MTRGVRTTVGAIAGLIAIVGVVVMVTRTSDTVTTHGSTAEHATTTSRAAGSDTTLPATTLPATAPLTRTSPPPPASASVRYSHLPSISLASLPKAAAKTLALIGTEGPFPYPQDGSVFENREGRLPRREAGHYREYTVGTPGSSDRGARRIVVGAKGERYYSDDHYASFREIVG